MHCLGYVQVEDVGYLFGGLDTGSVPYTYCLDDFYRVSIRLIDSHSTSFVIVSCSNPGYYKFISLSPFLPLSRLISPLWNGLK